MRKVLIPLLALMAVAFAVAAAQAADASGNIITAGTDVQVVNLIDNFKIGITGPDKAKAPSELTKQRTVTSSLATPAIVDYKYAFKNGVYVGAEFSYSSVQGTVNFPKSVSDTKPKFIIQEENIGPLAGRTHLDSEQLF